MTFSWLKRTCAVAATVALPLIVSAATPAPTDFKGLAEFAVGLITTATGIAVGIGIVYYMWGVVTALNDSGSAKGWERFRGQILWGILALFVMFSIWGILRLLTNALFP